MRFPIRARYLVSCSLPRTLAMCAAAVFNRLIDELIFLTPSFRVVHSSKMEDRHMSALLLQTLQCCDKPRLWNCPPSSCHGVLYPRYYRLVGTFSCKTAPARGTRGVVLLSLRVWKGCHCLGTRDWYLMHYSNPFVTGGQKHTHTLGLYVYNFVYFSEDPTVKRYFKRLLTQLVMVEFMGTVEWFLGTHFQWLVSEDKVWVHLSQTGFAANLVEDNNAHEKNITPDATLHQSSLPINTIPESDKDDDNPVLVECKQKYQSIIGSIGWLAHSTHPNLAATHTSLTAYLNKPSHSY